MGGKLSPDNQAIVGTRLQGLRSQPVRMRSAGRTDIWVDVHCRLAFDEHEGKFLAVQGSVCGLYIGYEPPELLLHYDFERDKERYAEAHIQVCARHSTFERYLVELGRKEVNGLHKIHLPVGGRRFRPSLEDLLECLAVEGLVDPKRGWEDVLEKSRREYRLRQVAAVVRRNVGTAVRELERLGYTVNPPKEKNLVARIRNLVASRQRDEEDIKKGRRPVAKR
ncbi:hypothetical protein HC031_25440 [Planosporangium thailandense]|uniref:Uncharacterized protein n=1 Tax=Planosporangium thailandense TaxID=765197 RepID=A0ABX0Y3S1_9ACTN|nr:hypothetical protein [Planosporangium thailandense]NJC73034.1 hypothetical protein [Planosporangium thailandense]